MHQMVVEGLKYRKLTVTECERLQTYPDGFSAKGIMKGKIVNISNTARYKALGNSFTVDVISHILIKKKIIIK
jgi:site-specific DNA-cytosine methylase